MAGYKPHIKLKHIKLQKLKFDYFKQSEHFIDKSCSIEYIKNGIELKYNNQSPWTWLYLKWERLE